ncbi:MAG: hypothetical protein MZW92_19210 [Comamonadaceae bacterium]|nr:hypothetical protein [Comamonadaceae bacterium]
MAIARQHRAARRCCARWPRGRTLTLQHLHRATPGPVRASRYSKSAWTAPSRAGYRADYIARTRCPAAAAQRAGTAAASGELVRSRKLEPIRRLWPDPVLHRLIGAVHEPSRAGRRCA